MIRISGLSKEFGEEPNRFVALKDINLSIETGDIYGIIGLSGAGKSTLVRCINYLEIPTQGEVVFDGKHMDALSKKELLAVRQSMGMIFQGFNLLAQRNVLANVCYPLEIAGVPRDKAKARARELLALVGLADREKAYPAQLSGGQKQRVAIARALATKPKLLLCDEATSALDPNTTQSILELLKEINRTLGVTIIVITHEMKVVESICNKVAVLDEGVIVEEGAVKDIFVAPKSEIARDLILPKGAVVTEMPKGRVIRLVYHGTESDEPTISNLTLACRVAVNIQGANTKKIGDKVYGQILLRLPDDDASVKRIYNYLNEHGLTFEEVN
ncbi:MAG: ATP-binding cassette domain-containing protein [Clostridia bacterium]|nr:ATP-binding cassette domain-containing protein [Clostridia bacterium]MBQ4623785.1 ATP-binding cassette domain-containing protein [Clostridia bacterium]